MPQVRDGASQEGFLRVQFVLSLRTPDSLGRGLRAEALVRQFASRI